MKHYRLSRILSVAFAALLPLSLAACGNPTQPSDAPGKVFYVATDGSNTNDGSEGKPFATLDAARDAIRALRASDGLPAGGVTVSIKEGTYYLTESLELTEQDAGEDGKPITYEGQGNVIVSGGVALNASDFVPASDDIKARLRNAQAKEKLLQIDLRAAGFQSLSAPEYSGGWVADALTSELFVGHERQTVSRWPNDTYAWAEKKFPADAEAQKLVVEVSPEQAAAWAGSENIYFYGFPQAEWNSTMTPVTSVDPQNNTIELRFADKQMNEGSGYYLFHILEETDAPGEYYIDYTTGMMYYYPTEEFGTSDIVISDVRDAVIYGVGANNTVLRGLTLECGTSNGIWLEADSVTVENCVVRDMGCHAIYLLGMHETVRNCELYNLGGKGIHINGGSPALTYSGGLIENNHIHDWSQVYTVYNPAIQLTGYGFAVRNNELHDAPHEAIAFDCGDSVIEYNEIYNVCDETADAGTIYTGRRWDWGGNCIRYNYIHDITDRYAEHHGGTPNAIYLDDAVSSQYIYGNIIENVDGYGIKSGGKKITLENNLFVNVSRAALFFHDGVGWGGATAYNDGYMWQMLSRSGFPSPLWRYRYPENFLLSELPQSAEGINPDDPNTRSYMTVGSNVACASPIAQFYPDDSTILQRHGNFYDNVEYGSLAAAGIGTDFSFTADSRVAREILNFRQIPFDRIGRK